MASIQAPPEPLSDGRIALRLSAERDIPEVLIAYQDDSRMHISLGERRPPSGAELGRGMEQAADDLKDGLAVRLTITEAGSDECAGQVIVDGFDWENARAELRIWVAPQLRGKGVASSALRLLAPWLLRACGLERVALLTEPGNEPMLRAARAGGFVEEGLLREYAREGRKRIDMVVLSVVSGDLR